VTDRLLDELFNERFAPGVQHSSPETAAESSDSSETNSRDFDGFSVKHIHACVIENFGDQLRLARFEVVVAENCNGRDSHSSANICDEFLGFFWESVICEISTEEQHICTA